MSDLIDRQAAIDALHMHLMYRMGTDSNKKRLDDWINGLPSAQPDLSEYSDKLWKAAYERGKAEAQQRWIPCSERIPGTTGAYLVACMNGNVKVGHFSTFDNKWTDAKAVAWMPLPEWEGDPV